MQVSRGSRDSFARKSGAVVRDFVYVCGSTQAGEVAGQQTKDKDAMVVGLGERNAKAALDTPKVIGTLSGRHIRSASVGAAHTLVCGKSGDVYSFGYGDDGRLGHAIPRYMMVPKRVDSLQSQRVVKVAAGRAHSLFLTDTGDVYACGNADPYVLGVPNPKGLAVIAEPARVEALKSVKIADISTNSSGGTSHSLALSSTGAVYFWGANTSGQAGIGSTSQHYTGLVAGLRELAVSSVTAGPNCSFFVSRDKGGVYVCGDDGGSGRFGLPALPNLVRVPTPLSSDDLAAHPALLVAAAPAHTLILCRDGTVLGCGTNRHGELAFVLSKSDTKKVPLARLLPLTPRAPAEGKRCVAVAAGKHHSLILLESGKAYSFGSNKKGALGAPPQATSSGSLANPLDAAAAPRQIRFAKDEVVAALACGLESSYFITRLRSTGSSSALRSSVTDSKRSTASSASSGTSSALLSGSNEDDSGAYEDFAPADDSGLEGARKNSRSSLKQASLAPPLEDLSESSRDSFVEEDKHHRAEAEEDVGEGDEEEKVEENERGKEKLDGAEADEKQKKSRKKKKSGISSSSEILESNPNGASKKSGSAGKKEKKRKSHSKTKLSARSATSAAMPDSSTLASFLERLELQNLQPVFEDNAVGLDELASLSAEDYARMGVKLGERQRILNALKAANGDLLPTLSESDIVFERMIGGGAFGEVWLGKLRGKTPIAIKKLKGVVDKSEFLREAQVMDGLSNHRNVVTFYGLAQSLSDDALYIVTEFVPDGSVESYLRNLGAHSALLSPRSLILMAKEVAAGMEHLAENGIVHRDLAARNLLVERRFGDEVVVKVCDFGLSRPLHASNYYQMHSGKIPVRWTAPEAVRFGRFTTMSDIWSYGVVLWEMFAGGEIPYGSLSNREVSDEVERGKRLAPPAGCPRCVYYVMAACWQYDPAARPSFGDLYRMLDRCEQCLQLGPACSYNDPLPVRGSLVDFDELNLPFFLRKIFTEPFDPDAFASSPPGLDPTSPVEDEPLYE